MILDDIIIRKLLHVKFIYDDVKNIHLYSSFFYISSLQIVSGYYIESLNQRYLIPVIGMKNINLKKKMTSELYIFCPPFYHQINKRKCRLFILIFERLTNHSGVFIYPKIINYL